jgi:error-prone DNA polymerase
MRSGRRVVFASLDDGTGLANVVFFPEAQVSAGAVVFRPGYLLVRGRTRRAGARAVSVTADAAWDLLEVARHAPTPDVAAPAVAV